MNYSTGAWIYEGGAINPGASPANYQDHGTRPDHLVLRSYDWVDAFPKKCTFCSTTAAAAALPLGAQTTLLAAQATAADQAAYDFQLDGEGYLMITRSDGLRAGFDSATGAFIGEIPGSDQIFRESGLLNIPNIIRVPHAAGMTYSLRIADRANAYGNQSPTANLNIFGQGFVTRLKGLKLDSPAEPASAQPGSNDVVSVTLLTQARTFRSASASAVTTG